MYYFVIAPAIRLSRMLNFRNKFLLIFFASIIPGIFLLLLSLQNDVSAIDRDKQELKGKAYISEISPLLDNVNQHRVLTSQFINGDQTVVSRIDSISSNVLAELQRLDDKAHSSDAEQWRDKLTAIKTQWQELDEKWQQFDSNRNAVAHIQISTMIDEFRHHIAGDTGLLLDPDAEIYYIMVSAVDTIPAINEQLEQLRLGLVSTLASGKIDAKRMGRIDSILERELPRLTYRLNNDIELASDVSPATAAQLAAQWQKPQKDFEQLSAQIEQGLLTGKFDASEISQQLAKLDNIRQQIDQLSHFSMEYLEESLEGRLVSEQRALLIKTLSGIAILLAVAWLIAGFATDLTRRARGLEQDMALLAAGDFSQHIRERGNDELSRVASSAVSLTSSLAGMMLEIKQSAAAMMSVADDVASASSQLANSSNEQTSASNSMAAAMEELSVSISHMAENAQHARQQSELSGKVSAQGAQVINNTVQSMQNIAQTVQQAAQSVQALGEDAQAISGIVGVIRAIADQTNLLALNAAIEAARAGESGRGFAVVADEVRNLAARTAVSTREISAMIERIQTGTKAVVDNMEIGMTLVQDGVGLAGEAGTAIASISDRSHEVEQTVMHMTSTLRDQSAASAEVAQKVEAIAAMSLENSQATQVTAKTAGQIQQLAQHLEAKISRFTF
ncbi:MAG: methyl-accepting chemotaxis protein [Gammaproteobacteria bacterium]|nr:methyl-accepting chemotaxis protein [Gammaproteobacteria bacterium]